VVDTGQKWWSSVYYRLVLRNWGDQNRATVDDVRLWVGGGALGVPHHASEFSVAVACRLKPVLILVTDTNKSRSVI
jgi:hypothetical protein